MKNYTFLLIVLSVTAFFFTGLAQSPAVELQASGFSGSVNPYQTDLESIAKKEVKQFKMLTNAMGEAASAPDIDIKYYKLNLSIKTSPSPNYLHGIVTISAVSTIENLTSITLDLRKTMTVDSVKTGNTRLSFSQQTLTVTINLDRVFGNGELITMDIYYGGLPNSGSFNFSSHAGTPWIWTQSDPYGARDWWPCKDHPSDKADSMDIWITVDSSFKVGSNGRLIAVIENGDGTKTHHWSEHYPISTYLVSLAITNFAEFTDWYKYTQADSMQILNYVLPEHLSEAKTLLSKTPDMLRIFSDRFGQYPFILEKYGHAEYGGDAMEHQTMTSIAFNSITENIVAHELAHHWFGDMITLANWSNIWLNEGFAVYCMALYFEAEYGISAYWGRMNNIMAAAKNAAGSVYINDTTDANNLFSTKVYTKGATVLHMLRHLLGDSLFFKSLKAYASDPRFRFGVATTEDFRHVCEAVSGSDLEYFFNEWIYGEDYPRYTYSWTAVPDTGGGYTIPIRIQQTTGTADPAFFTMPIDIRLSGSDFDTTIVLLNNLADQDFSVHTRSMPDLVQLDPDNWILKSNILTSVSSDLLSQVPRLFRLDQNYPNPFNPATTIKYQIPSSAFVSLKIYDMLGKEVAVLVNEEELAGTYKIDFNAANLASSVYLYKMEAGDFIQTKKMIVLK